MQSAQYCEEISTQASSKPGVNLKQIGVAIDNLIIKAAKPFKANSIQDR